MALIYNATFNSGTRVLSLLDKAGNVISSCEVPGKRTELTLTATADNSSVKLLRYGTVNNTYEVNTGSGWVPYTFVTDIKLNKGQSCKWRCTSHPTTFDHSTFVKFAMMGRIEASGEVYSMLSSNLSDVTTLKGYDYAFGGLFMLCSALTQAPQLPATTLAPGCYEYMFNGCQSLTKAPELPATTLADYCYDNMFSECGSLKEVRVSATTTAYMALTNWLSYVSATGDFYCDPNATIFPTDSASGIPKNWRRLNINEEAPTVDDITKPLTFKATQDGSTVKLSRIGSPAGAFQTSRDGGNTWEDYTLNTSIALNTGEEVAFRAKADRSAQDAVNYFSFTMTGKLEAWHNVMSLYRTNDFATYNTTPGTDTFNSLFRDCTSLTKAPVLPATTITDSCYYGMFRGCQSLTKAPELPATTLDSYCYGGMFSGCQSLTKAPELPATTLAQNCYRSMFSGCQSLTKAPELPATTLADRCYESMFSGCQSLKEVRVSATKTASYALDNWLSGVSETGDFYCDPNATIFPTGNASGIPKNWNRRNIADYPTT